MPSDEFAAEGPFLREEDAEALLRGICFKTGPPRTVGVELEWLVHDLYDPELPVRTTRLARAFDGLRDLPCDRR